MIRLAALALLLLTACAPLQAPEPLIADPIMEDPVLVEEDATVLKTEPAISRTAPLENCIPGDDGIGGTGCKEE